MRRGVVLLVALLSAWGGAGTAMSPTPDPAASVPELIEVPAGRFLMGAGTDRDPDAFENERWSATAGEGEVDLPAFYIARTETTVAQFAAFGAINEQLTTLIGLARAQLEMLDLAGAVQTTDTFWSLASRSASPRLRHQLAIVRADVLAQCGRLQEARSLIAGLRRELELPVENDTAGRADALLARLALADGDAEQRHRADRLDERRETAGTVERDTTRSGERERQRDLVEGQTGELVARPAG